ncbi:MAG: hypothetical protein MRY83_01780, partial [Flavobacteriales bacterium]|nr:hypothetical protein [Flavobacteriales bacterium]
LLSRLKFGAEDSNFSVITSERPRLWKLEEKLSIAKSNVIVLPSTNKVFTSDVLTKLNTFREDYDIKLYAFDKIKEYDNIDVAYFENLDVHLLTNFLVTDTMRFEVLDQAFQKEYRSSLDRFSLLGYNLGNYFGKALYLYGDNFHDKLSDFSFNGLGYNFDYIKTGFENGYENKSLKFTKYSNFNFVPIN